LAPGTGLEPVTSALHLS